jgi:soluble lytic murein transglycosylase-like protein
MPCAARTFRATLALLVALAPVTPVFADTTSASVSENAYARAMRSINPRLPEGQSRAYATALLANAERMHLDPRLVMAVVTVESHWDERAISVDGAIGLGQLKPETARNLGVDAWSGKSNLRGITIYLHRLIGLFRSSRSAIGSAIASYNAGPIAVQQNGGEAPGYASQHYVAKVFATWHGFKSRLSGQTAKHELTSTTSIAHEQVEYWGAN